MSGLWFNSLLKEAGLDLKDVALIRHQTYIKGRPTPYTLWVNGRDKFEQYQSYQGKASHRFFSRPYWASFVVPPDKSTLFVGIYESRLIGTAEPGCIDPLTNQPPQTSCNPPIPCDVYHTALTPYLNQYIGRLKIDWGRGFIGWKQTAAKQNKEIIELAKQFQQPDFPGFSKFIVNLGDVPSLPQTWISALSSVKGIYLLTCPRTKEQYVGKATGEHGFWGRWQFYVVDGAGGNVGLKSREPSDYQISILEVCASTATEAEIGELESLWKRKLQSREMGLNRN